MDLLNKYFKIQKKIYDYFGYVENWVAIPIDDATEYLWFIENDEVVRFAKDEETLYDEGMSYYENEIYRQRFLQKWVYRAKDYTMICVDTHTDGNKFLQIFDNSKERKQR